MSEREIREHWNTPEMAFHWSLKNVGVDKRDKAAVKKSLEESQFYTGLSSDSSLLDLGVGAYSYLNPTLLPPQATVLGVDFAEEMLMQLRNTSQRHDSFVTASAAELPFSNNTFDRVLTTFMMRYLTTDKQATALSEMIRTTKSGGQIHLIDFEWTSYPQEVSTFHPGDIRSIVNDPVFNRRHDKEKSVNMITATEIPGRSLSTPLVLHHMKIDIK